VSVLGVRFGVLQVSDSIKDFRRRRIAYLPPDACVGVYYV